ncbi:hypothetical protein TNIN_500401 [Trichonephila inaurata madagascariensis]|uniref:Uncharacterized protein n=1 Tax=Trichonephila inaurata madagascariensis TaxID=2747483 RepID=A0A8X7C436_9ARAC|nr:hypothetical protein TNIN_500401 [Trichonephila inaurata madagascariensis]
MPGRSSRAGWGRGCSGLPRARRRPLTTLGWEVGRADGFGRRPHVAGALRQQGAPASMRSGAINGSSPGTLTTMSRPPRFAGPAGACRWRGRAGTGATPCAGRRRRCFRHPPRPRSAGGAGARATPTTPEGRARKGGFLAGGWRQGAESEPEGRGGHGAGENKRGGGSPNRALRARSSQPSSSSVRASGPGTPGCRRARGGRGGARDQFPVPRGQKRSGPW